MHIHARQSKKMGALRLSLALFLLLLSSPVQAQWWSLIWANPKTTTSYSPLSITSPTITSLGPSDTPGTTEWVVTENGVAEKSLEDSSQKMGYVLTPTRGASVIGDSTAEPGTLPPEESAGGSSKANIQFKPLKHWKSGELLRSLRG